MYLDESEKALIGFESKVPWMYLDTRGKVTVGVGLMLRSAVMACTLPFLKANGAIASAADVAAEFNRVAAMRPAQVASAYRSPSSLLLADSECMAQLRRFLVAEDSKLRQFYGAAYVTAPDAAKLGLLDIGYNCGTEDLELHWPHLDEAVKMHDWQRAAADCHRPQAPSLRNDWTYQQFLNAYAQQH